MILGVAGCAFSKGEAYRVGACYPKPVDQVDPISSIEVGRGMAHSQIIGFSNEKETVVSQIMCYFAVKKVGRRCKNAFSFG